MFDVIIQIQAPQLCERAFGTIGMIEAIQWFPYNRPDRLDRPDRWQMFWDDRGDWDDYMETRL